MIRIICYIYLLLMLSGASSAAKYDNCIRGNKDTIGDFLCDNEKNNNEECAYDGGDCCPCTNFVSWYDDYVYQYWDMFCRDPSSGCLDPRVVVYSNSTDSVIPELQTFGAK